jgi:iron-sulfur cluster insertion protein
MSQESSIQITASALARVQQLINEKKNNKLKLRVYIVGGGCSGFQYGFSFDEETAADDFAVLQDNITVLVDALSMQYLDGATVDFQESLQGSRFVVINPNAETTCGCGASFSLKEEKEAN